MSSNDNDSDNALDVAINYLIVRSPTPMAKKSDERFSGGNTEGQNGSAEDPPGREGSTTIRWADPIATEIPNPPLKSDESK
ncbi:hypothetical protein F4811DRAFT_499877 [Daldinia bambusicola]|nr:hypothetical protein F4811DRAFT_499877 [Daldinia bambusicola]